MSIAPANIFTVSDWRTAEELNRGCDLMVEVAQRTLPVTLTAAAGRTQTAVAESQHVSVERLREGIARRATQITQASGEKRATALAAAAFLQQVAGVEGVPAAGSDPEIVRLKGLLIQAGVNAAWMDRHPEFLFTLMQVDWIGQFAWAGVPCRFNEASQEMEFSVLQDISEQGQRPQFENSWMTWPEFLALQASRSSVGKGVVPQAGVIANRRNLAKHWILTAEGIMEQGAEKWSQLPIAKKIHQESPRATIQIVSKCHIDGTVPSNLLPSRMGHSWFNLIRPTDAEEGHEAQVVSAGFWNKRKYEDEWDVLKSLPGCYQAPDSINGAVTEGHYKAIVEEFALEDDRLDNPSLLTIASNVDLILNAMPADSQTEALRQRVLPGTGQGDCVQLLVDLCAAQDFAQENELLRALNELRDIWKKLPDASKPVLVSTSGSQKVHFLEDVLVTSQTQYQHSYQLLGRNCAWTANRYKTLALSLCDARRITGDQITDLYGEFQVDASTLQGKWWRALLDFFVRALHLFYCKVLWRTAGVGKGVERLGGGFKATPLTKTNHWFPALPEWTTPRALATGNTSTALRNRIANRNNAQVLDVTRRARPLWEERMRPRRVPAAEGLPHFDGRGERTYVQARRPNVGILSARRDALRGVEQPVQDVVDRDVEVEALRPAHLAQSNARTRPVAGVLSILRRDWLIRGRR